MTDPVSSILDPARHGIRIGHISLLMATRRRPEMLAEEIQTLSDNTVGKKNIALWIYVDDDDLTTRSAIDEKKFPDPGFPIHWHIGPRPAALGQTHQALWNVSGRNSEIYMIISDDIRFDTRGWDEAVRREFERYTDGVLIAFAEDPSASDQATYPFIGWGFLQTLGFEKVFPGIFPFWFDDKWVEHIGLMAGRRSRIPMLLNPIGGDKGKTQRMRCVPFWTRFFQLLQTERKECAGQLIAAMFPQDASARQSALMELEKTFAALKKRESDSFSEDYATFQEERHTALKPEDRNRFNPLYIRQEMTAVLRLLSHAQKNIAAKNYMDGLELIEATQMSDLRLRQAQDMKLECLRALGRNAEADKLARENFLAWPESSFVRRIFRFFGMIANEVRSIAADRTRKKKSSKSKP